MSIHTYTLCIMCTVYIYIYVYIFHIDVCIYIYMSLRHNESETGGSIPGTTRDYFLISSGDISGTSAGSTHHM